MFHYIIGFSDTILPVLALIVFFLLWRKIGGKEKLLFYFLWINFIIFGSTNVLAAHKINNLFLYHIYALVELWLMGYYIVAHLLYKKSLWFKICLGYSILWVLDIILLEPLNTFPSFSGGLSNLILMVISMVYLLRLAKSDEILYFQKVPAFWIVSAFLISCSFLILGYVMYNFYVVNRLPELGNQITTILYISTILKFTLIIFGLLCYRRPRTQLFLL
ncbi:MAG: hypothetical protein JSS67_12200 [Bacteroidetes bacterium]|nr:hypothetical protein [Bacteroidota bacterium]